MNKTKVALLIMGLGLSTIFNALNFFSLSGLLGYRVVWFDSNILIAGVEMALLIFSIGTCIVASEMGYRYLQIQDMVYDDSEKETKP